MEDRQRWLDGLAEALDFFATHEDVPVGYGVTIDVPVHEDILDVAKKIGTFEKDTFSEQFFVLRKRFGPHRVDFYANREAVCTKEVVGTEVVYEPDPDAPKVKVERPVYKWSCPDSLLARGEK